MRLIDADRALAIVHDQRIAHPNAYHLTNYATLILREAPTVDAVEVVRCEDCIYWQSGDNEAEKWEYCALHNHNVGPHAFCSLGERKEGADNGP